MLRYIAWLTCFTVPDFIHCSQWLTSRLSRGLFDEYCKTSFVTSKTERAQRGQLSPAQQARGHETASTKYYMTNDHNMSLIQFAEWAISKWRKKWTVGNRPTWRISRWVDNYKHHCSLGLRVVPLIIYGVVGVLQCGASAWWHRSSFSDALCLCCCWPRPR